MALVDFRNAVGLVRHVNLAERGQIVTAPAAAEKPKRRHRSPHGPHDETISGGSLIAVLQLAPSEQGA